MQIITGEQPDFWYDSTDVTPHTFVIIRRESVTCCGFLGGDTLILVTSGAQLADIIDQFRPVLPFYERNNFFPNLREPHERLLKIQIDLRSSSLQEIGNYEMHYQKIDDILMRLNDTVWLAGMTDPFRFNLELCGDLSTFLQGPIYPKKLISSLQWWYENEASPEERENYRSIPRIDHLICPDDADLIVKSINLYNHGAYELTRT